QQPAAGREQEQQSDGQRRVRRGQHRGHQAQQRIEAALHESAGQQSRGQPPGQQCRAQAGPQRQRNSAAQRGLGQQIGPGRGLPAAGQRGQGGPRDRQARQREQGQGGALAAHTA